MSSPAQETQPAIPRQQYAQAGQAKEDFKVVIHSGMTRDELAALKADLKSKDIDLIINEEEYGTNGKLNKVVGKIKFPDGNTGNFSGFGTNMRVEITRSYENGKGGNLNVWVGSGAGTQPPMPTPPAVPGTAVVPTAPAAIAAPVPATVPSPPPATPAPGAPAAVSISPAPSAPGAPAAISITPAPPTPPSPPAVAPQPEEPVAIEPVTGSVVIRANADGQGDPIFILNGKKLPDDEAVKLLNPDEIESVSVMKGDKAIKKYGEEGKNGVIIIETHKKKKK
ncbi:MAG: hypothetical protein R3C61_11490 [Bacteroidia bacterium]